MVRIDQCHEALCGGEVFEGQRSLAAVVAPQHPVGTSGAVLLGVDVATALDVT